VPLAVKMLLLSGSFLSVDLAKRLEKKTVSMKMWYVCG